MSDGEIAARRRQETPPAGFSSEYVINSDK